jgi:hypothetical protein
LDFQATAPPCGNEDGSPEEELQLAASKNGGLVYTELDLKIQNGDSG